MRALPSGVWVLAIGLIASSCRPVQQGSSVKNIYQADEMDRSRRHEASAMEINWTVRSSKCSALLLSPTLMITANHCRFKPGEQLQSSAAIVSRSRGDLEVTAILESNVKLDFALIAVKWLNPMPASQAFPPYLASSPADVFSSPNKDQGDRVFTVGFPDDKAKVWNGTYAEGQIKFIHGHQLYINIGVINGNSGGGILKKENNMLVGIAIGGTKAYGEAGWDKNSTDDYNNWNFGTPTWAIYALSPTLRKQFPEGKNLYYGNTYFPKTRLYLSLQAEETGAKLRVSTNHQAELALICPSTPAPCKPDSPGVEILKFDFAANGRRFYSRTKGTSPEELADLNLIAFDKSGSRIGGRRVQLEKENGP